MMHSNHPLQNVKILRSESFSAVMGLISPRDFIDVILAERNDDMSFTCGLFQSAKKYTTFDFFGGGGGGGGGCLFCCSGRGVDYPHPEDPGYVRGMNHPSAMLCFAVKG